jgi:hypothetical protein
MPAKLRCFVAMAFGHKDTDAIFRALRRTLGPLGVNAQRVDRIEHNDNIDTRIISEIEAADLVIADLTYARPSVYFEAGYAQRAIPVMFTARSDHFRERDNDPNGNRHVHFDLKMFVSAAMDLWAYTNGVILDFSRRGKPTDNAAIESFNGRFRDECLNVHWFEGLEDATTKIEAWRQDYNANHPHRALKGLSPNEYARMTMQPAAESL